MSTPKTIEALHRAARVAMRNGQLRDAHQHCLAILEQDSRHADAWFICGIIASANGQVAKAVDIFQRAAVLAPDNAEYLAEMAKGLFALNKIPEALATARQAVDLAPTAIPTWSTLGTIFSHTGEHARALHCYEKAAKFLVGKGENRAGLSVQWCAELYFNLGTSLEFAGQTGKAEEAFEQAIHLQPEFYRAHFALSQLRRATLEDNHLARLHSLRENAGNSQARLHLGHAIAKELEDLGQYAEALENLHWAKEGRAREIDYRPEQDSTLFSAMESGFGKSLFGQATRGCDSVEPIFVVGMPRTGTTLVERILSSHSSVFAAGELQDFPLQVKRLAGTASSDVLDLDTLKACVHLDPAALGQAYIDSTRPRTGYTARFVDKLPLNFLYLGLIHLALPNAKLVCLRRDPMDTCLSNYRQLFATNFRYYYYSYDLLDCGRYYLQFDKLMRHWHSVMPGVVHEVQYETLVAEPETTARDLLAFCELDWESRCLEFHRHKGSVATPSAAQVRQPIYNSSIDRWRQYGDALRPLYDLLSSGGGYPRSGD